MRSDRIRVNKPGRYKFRVRGENPEVNVAAVHISGGKWTMEGSIQVLGIDWMNARCVRHDCEPGGLVDGEACTFLVDVAPFSEIALSVENITGEFDLEFVAYHQHGGLHSYDSRGTD